MCQGENPGPSYLPPHSMRETRPPVPLLFCRLATGLDGMRIENKGHMSTLTFFSVSREGLWELCLCGHEQTGLPMPASHCMVSAGGLDTGLGRAAVGWGGRRDQLACVHPYCSPLHLRCACNPTTPPGHSLSL